MLIPIIPHLLEGKAYATTAKTPSHPHQIFIVLYEKENQRGILHVSFLHEDNKNQQYEIAKQLEKKFPQIDFNFSDEEGNSQKTYDILSSSENLQLYIDQAYLHVSQAMCNVKWGKTSSYKRLADALYTHPRAIGRRVGRNEISLFIPCHRIIYITGQISSYRWGKEMKQFLLNWEKINKKGKCNGGSYEIWDMCTKACL